MPLSPELFSPAMRDTVRDAVGSLTVPGLSAVQTVLLGYALLWLVPVLLCLRRLRSELTRDLYERYREGGTVWLLAGLVAVFGFLGVGALYALSALSVMTWERPDVLLAMPLSALCVKTCVTLWVKLAPVTAPLQLMPIAVLATALSAHVAAEAVRWLSTHSLRAARNQRTRAVLAQLEAQQSQDDKPRGTIRYW